MRVLVCGGRTYNDRKAVYAALDHLNPQPKAVIHGGANGADRIADDWADDRGITTIAYHADWTKHGKAAGPIRNALMLAESKPDLVLAFPGGNGTADMVARAKAANVPVLQVDPCA
jgi:predicted polyphosphate/ATP-dependent NAD kinase